MRKVYTDRLIILILVLLLFPMKFYGASVAVKCVISGVVQDHKNGEGLPFASVQVLTTSDSSLVKGTMTDAYGKYVIKDMQAGEYLVTASYMGYSEKKKELSVQSRKVNCDFLLAQKSISLAGISVTAEQELVEKTIY